MDDLAVDPKLQVNAERAGQAGLQLQTTAVDLFAREARTTARGRKRASAVQVRTQL